MITLDTSGIFALLNRRDPDHRRARAALTAGGGPYLVPAGIRAEVTSMLERTLHAEILDAFLEDLQTGSFTRECGADDLGRVRALVRQYADLPLGFAGAAAAGCAERHGGRVPMFDRRHFGAIASAGLVTVVPGQEE
jgi:hypothetical protein